MYSPLRELNPDAKIAVRALVWEGKSNIGTAILASGFKSHSDIIKIIYKTSDLLVDHPTWFCIVNRMNILEMYYKILIDTYENNRPASRLRRMSQVCRGPWCPDAEQRASCNWNWTTKLTKYLKIYLDLNQYFHINLKLISLRSKILIQPIWVESCNPILTNNPDEFLEILHIYLFRIALQYFLQFLSLPHTLQEWIDKFFFLFNRNKL